MICQIIGPHWHIHFDTNITPFPYWKTNPKGQMIANTQCTYCQSCSTFCRPFLEPSPSYQCFGQLVFSPIFFTPSTTTWKTNDTTYTNEKPLGFLKGGLSPSCLKPQILGMNVGHILDEYSFCTYCRLPTSL